MKQQWFHIISRDLSVSPSNRVFCVVFVGFASYCFMLFCFALFLLCALFLLFFFIFCFVLLCHCLVFLSVLALFLAMYIVSPHPKT